MQTTPHAQILQVSKQAAARVYTARTAIISILTILALWASAQTPSPERPAPSGDWVAVLNQQAQIQGFLEGDDF